MPESESVTDHLILLDRNENPYGPAPACLQILRNVTSRELSFYGRDYERGVKSKLSERLAELFGLPEEQVFLSYGSEDMLKQAVHCYLAPGEKILTPNLSWWYYKSVAAEVNGITLEYKIREGPDAYYYDLENLSNRLEAEKPRILLLASPNNPTGNSISTEALDSLLERTGSTITVLDEAYHGFSRNQDDPAPRLVREHDNLLVLRTFSKFYALAGARIGFALAGKNLDRLKRFSARYLGYNLLSEQLALAALESVEYYERMRKRIIEDRGRYLQVLNSNPGWKAYESDANFLLVKTPEGTIPPLRNWLLSKGIKVKFFNEAPMQDCIRITVGTKEQNEVLITAIKEFVEQNVSSGMLR